MLDCLWQPDAEDLQRTAHFVGQIHCFLEQCLSCAQQRTQTMCFMAFHLNGAEPTGAQYLRYTIGIRFVRLVHMADNAALTCLASIQTLSKPFSCRPKNKCWLNEPASNPTRSIDWPKPARQSAMSSTSHGNSRSRCTLPFPSMMQSAHDRSDTSDPTLNSNICLPKSQHCYEFIGSSTAVQGQPNCTCFPPDKQKNRVRFGLKTDIGLCAASDHFVRKPTSQPPRLVRQALQWSPNIPVRTP